MHQNYKRLLTSLLLIGATQISSMVQAEGIRLIGPSGEVRSSPSFTEVERASSTPLGSDQPSRFFGPTRSDETLWSIASQLRPSSRVSVQQTLLAFYKINPQAFDNQNIHELIPGSRLRVPSLEQIQSASTEQAIAIMNAHQARLGKTLSVGSATSVGRTASVSQTTPVVNPSQEKAPVDSSTDVPSKSAQTGNAKSLAPTDKKVASVKAVDSPASLEAKPSSTLPELATSAEGQQQVVKLKDKLQATANNTQPPETELSALEEKNHRLRLMLSEVQNEVESLKSSLNDQDRIRAEVEKLLAEERQNMQEQQRLQPSAMDDFLSNGWLVGLVGIIPGALLALLLIWIIGRRKQATSDTPQNSQNLESLAAPAGLAAAGAMSNELAIDDALLNEDDEQGTEQGAANEVKGDAEDVFADLNEDEFDFNLDDGDDPFANISDDGNLNLDLDEQGKTNDIQDDLEADIEAEIKASDAETELDEEDDPLGFDLSDESPSDSLSAEAFSELLASDEPEQELQGGEVEQSMLDDLLASVADDEMTLATSTEEVDNEDKPNEQDLDVQDFDEQSSDVQNTATVDSPSIETTAEQDIDDLLAEFEATNTQEADLQSDPLQEELSTQSSMPETSDLENSSDDESQFENINDDATALLDELLDEHNDDSFDELDSLQELEDIAGLSEEPSLTDDSTELLDELLDFEEDVSLDQEFDPLDELESLTHFDEENSNTDLDEDSVDLLDELLDESALDSHLNAPNDTLSSLNDPLSPLNDEPSEHLPEPNEPSKSNFIDDDFAAELDALLDENAARDDELFQVAEEPELQAQDIMASASAVDERQSADVAQSVDMPQVEATDDIAEETQSSIIPEPEASLSEQLEAELPEVQQPEPEELQAYTPTPNTIENEFGIPQEEDWSFDDSNVESAENTPAQPDRSEQDAAVQEDMANINDLPELEPVNARDTISDSNIDELDLPEFNEQDALDAMSDEPSWSEPDEPVASLENDEELSFDERELPEFDEEDALASMTQNKDIRQDSSQASAVIPELHQSVQQAENDQDALFEVFAHNSELPSSYAQDTQISEPELDQPNNEALGLESFNPSDNVNSSDNFDESAMASLLSETDDIDAFSGTLDNDTIASGGLDLETMLNTGDDWDGFLLSPDDSTSELDIPQDERDVWTTKEGPAQPEIAAENWADQDEVAGLKSEKGLPEQNTNSQANKFMTIDELMAKVDKDGGEFEEQDLNLDVGLNEFPDVIGDIGDIDVDTNAEASGKLDLAKIYLEMNDYKGAVKLLEEAIVYGEDDIRREAKSLIDAIHGR
ncbi:hypothetical protein BS333_09660 [Vibrio azureus]|uniref:Uncharacterized protein n=1 Tax=Vibrio azureus NBRC 104587 TaxID=1219077 RepID=U3C0L5_9VIBR|nr:FimV/HubP family polar landmark protein [Vibrio azureus]AUI86627.1 hypothetical protein BS333_09660 [Vibrio azureus]GAD75059.1 hypothetical protein VAZ01S_018_00350 [Vibrio azureus NBRC 104587]